MSTPTEPTPPQPDHAPESADVQPTEVYPPAGQPTYGVPGDAAAYGQPAPQAPAAYPSPDAQPTEAYAPAGPAAYGQPAAPPVYGQAPYGQAPYGQAPYGQAPSGSPGTGVYGDPTYAAAAVPAADRPRGLGWASLGVAIGGLVLVGAAFIPLAWVSLVLALVGGLLLLVAFVLGIVTLVSKKQGGKGLGIGALVVSVLGGVLWILALTASLVWIGLSVAGSSSGTSDPEISVSEEASPGDEESSGEEVPAGVYDETAYLAMVRPEIFAIMQEIEPSVTQELVDSFYTDEMLVSVGTSVLALGDMGGDAVVDGIVQGSDGMLSDEQALRFYETIRDAAQQYLVE